MALTPQDSINQHTWVCQRCQHRNNDESRFCHSPTCRALMTPAISPMRGLLAAQMYADEVAIILDRYGAPPWAEEATWQPEPEAELSPRYTPEPEAEPLGSVGHPTPRPGTAEH